jgi:hypothetical protein
MGIAKPAVFRYNSKYEKATSDNFNRPIVLANAEQV